ncbi:hypothetical protein ACMA1D_02050 [Streptomyces sp. 796.1]|uniref:hypothetical protein n=1 Tax=Streptomyces sp. 796.1 TaxID=3163029 RepID=UPI0039C9B326
MEHVRGSNFRVLNRGAATAAGVVFLDEGRPALFGWPDEPVTLAGGSSHLLSMQGAGGKRMPVQLLVTWEGQEEPVPLQVPPRTD